MADDPAARDTPRLTHELAAAVLAAQPFSALVGARLTAFGDGAAVLEVDVRDELRQQHGFVHGGVLSYLADNALTFAGGSALGAAVLTAGMTVDYLRPARDGVLRARATVTDATARQAVCRCEVLAVAPDGTETVCAVAQGDDPGGADALSGGPGAPTPRRAPGGGVRSGLPPRAGPRDPSATVRAVSGTTGTDGAAPLAIGVDGARGGWLAAVAHGRGDVVARTELRLLPDLEALVALRRRGDAAAVCIDVPIGLPDAQELRACDRAARERLGARRSSVFEPPARTLLHAANYADARRRLTALPGGRSVSAQAFALLPRIREADELLQRDPSAAGWLHECHPEVAFAELTGDELPAKRSVAGAARRLEALRADPDLGDVADRLAALDAPAKDAALDDALDAYAALWSALRVRRGTAERLGLDADGTPARDTTGVPMSIVF